MMLNVQTVPKEIDGATVEAVIIVLPDGTRRAVDASSFFAGEGLAETEPEEPPDWECRR